MWKNPGGAAVGGARHLNRDLFIQHQFLVEARVVGPASAAPAVAAASATEDRGGYDSARESGWPDAESGRRCPHGQARQFVLDGGAAFTGLGRLGQVYRLGRSCRGIFPKYFFTLASVSWCQGRPPARAPRYWARSRSEKLFDVVHRGASRSSMEPITE